MRNRMNSDENNSDSRDVRKESWEVKDEDDRKSDTDSNEDRYDESADDEDFVAQLEPTIKEITYEEFIKQKEREEEVRIKISDTYNANRQQFFDGLNKHHSRILEKKEIRLKELQEQVNASEEKERQRREEVQQQENERQASELAGLNEAYRLMQEKKRRKWQRMFKNIGMSQHIKKEYTKKELEKRRKKQEGFIPTSIHTIFVYSSRLPSVMRINFFMASVISFISNRIDEEAMDKHLNRNAKNKEARGVLMCVQGNLFVDENGCLWKMKPAYLNIFHEDPRCGISTVKFIRERVGMRGSYETIRILKKNEKPYDFTFQGKNKRSGKGQQTRNFSSGGGHYFKDMVPHVQNENYRQFPPVWGAPTFQEKYEVLQSVLGHEYQPESLRILNEDYAIFLEKLKKKHKVPVNDHSSS